MKKFFNLFLIALVGAFLVGCGDSKSSGQSKKDDTQVDNTSKNPEAPAAVKTPYELFLADFWGTGKELSFALGADLGAPTDAGADLPSYDGGVNVAHAVGNAASSIPAGARIYVSSATSAPQEVASLKIEGKVYADTDPLNVGNNARVYATTTATTPAAVGPAANSTMTAAQLKTAGIVLSQSASDKSITLTLAKKVGVGTLAAAAGAAPGAVTHPVNPLNAAVRKFELRIKKYDSTRSGVADVLARVSNNGNELFAAPISFGEVNFSVAP